MSLKRFPISPDASDQNESAEQIMLEPYALLKLRSPEMYESVLRGEVALEDALQFGLWKARHWTGG